MGWDGWMGTWWWRWWWGERSWIRTRCVVLLDGREVDGMDENMVALLEGRAELDTVVLLDGKEVDGLGG